MSKANGFGMIRSVLWPLHRHEWKKFIPMFCMLFLIGFNYSIIRNLKDTIVITAKFSGAEVIPFIKVWAMFPAALFFTFFYTRLSNRYSQKRVFYVIMTTFLLFFSLFIYVLYPLQDVIHPLEWADRIDSFVPKGCRGFVAMGRYWSFTLFYVMAECWGNIVLSLLFWGFANHITSVEESGRFYGHLHIASNLAGALAGQVANYLSNGRTWDQAIANLMHLILLAGFIILIIFYLMNRYVLNKTEYAHFHEKGAGEIKKKKKMRLRESFRYLTQSKYLSYVAIMVLGYNMSINLVEVIWKAQLRELYPDSLQFNTYMNNMTSIFCLVSVVEALLLARFLRKFGWTSIALLTPLTLLITGVTFFGFLLFRPFLEGITFSLFGFSTLSIVVFLGAMQVVMSKAAKYSIFDTTKEMVFIPLSNQEKIRGKAAIDGIGSRLGKSGGSVVHQGFLMLFGSLQRSTPYVGMVLFGVISVWLSVTRSLGKKYQAHVAESMAPVPTTSSWEVAEGVVEV